MSTLTFEGATVRYGTGRHTFTAVDAVDLTVPSGKIVGLVGESGSGKSTLARAAVGLAETSGGLIRVDGVPLKRGVRGRGERPVQMVFQDPYSSLDPRMTVGDTIREALAGPRRRGTRSAAWGGRWAARGRGAGGEPGTAVTRPGNRDAATAELLDMVGLPYSCARAYPAALSGGQRQRIAVARALAGRPEVLIADEITSALDVSVQGMVLNLVRELQRELGLTMLFISHNLAVVRYISDIVAVMYLGRLVECGPVHEVLTDVRHPYTRELLGSAPHRGASVIGEAGTFGGPDIEPADPHRPPSGCRFHPRCPVGPEVVPGRDACRIVEPSRLSLLPLHQAACHFAEEQPRPRGTAGPAG